MKVLVTGGAGFIGSHIVESLISKNHEVKIFDNFSTGSLDNIQDVRDSVEVIRGDILDLESLTKAMQDVDLVSHHAAQLEIFLSADAPERDLETNTIGTLNVLKAAKSSNVRKIVNASSACIYGQVEGLTKETFYPRPNWPYGASKFAAELYANIYNDAHAIPVVNLRYGITYGEREWYRRVLTIFIKRALENLPIVVFGSGDQIRDFIYVKDAVDLHNRCLFGDNANGHSFNVGTGVGTSILDLAKLVIAASGNSIELVHEETPEGGYSKLVPDKRRNPAELRCMLLDSGKADSILGWSASTTLEQGISKELGWARENLQKWQSIVYSKV